MPPDRQQRVAEPVRYSVRLTVAALVLALVLLAPRAWILYRSQFTEWPRHDAVLSIATLCIAGSHDAGFSAGVAMAFCVLLICFRKNAESSRRIYRSFLLVGAICVVAAVAHVRVLAQLGRPFNYRWLYYSDFLRSIDSHQALLASVEWKLLTAILCGVAVYLLAAMYLGQRIESRIRASMRAGWTFTAAVMGALLLWSVLGQVLAKAQNWDRAKLVNPLYEFARSAVVAASQPALFTMQAPEFEAGFSQHRGQGPGNYPGRARIRHVIIFVLESTPAEYLGIYGSSLGVTPNIDRWARQAAIFENIYAHAPATNKALFSILCATYPWISYKSESEEKPDISLPSVVSELRRHGYSTGFFSSGDLAFQSARDFLQARGFERLEDYKDRKNNRAIYRSEKWPFLDGSDDVSTTESLTAWLEQQSRAARPFFGMVWTNMTHYPYFTDSTLHSFGPGENLLNRYLNALHVGDKALGVLMRSLEKAGIAGETVVVIVGDHGEAFGRHNQLAHAGGIYEENCHVPLLLVNSALFSGERHDTVGGLVDIAPTIMDILGRQSPPEWQGRSLLSGPRTGRTWFFSSWSDYLFGYRDGNMKFIYNATRDSYEIYDLSRDREERFNRIGDYRKNIFHSMSLLSGWVQHQNRLFRRLIPDN